MWISTRLDRWLVAFASLYVIILKIATYLLIPWSRVLLEKLTSKLRS